MFGLFAGLIGLLFGRRYWAPAASSASSATPTPIPDPDAPNAQARFLSSLNQFRVAQGRPPLAWSASLADFASRNNVYQGRRGMGHYLYPPPPYGQCAARSQSLAQALGLWINDPPHRAILLMALTKCGASSDGDFQTLNLG